MIDGANHTAEFYNELRFHRMEHGPGKRQEVAREPLLDVDLLSKLAEVAGYGEEVDNRTETTTLNANK